MCIGIAQDQLEHEQEREGGEERDGQAQPRRIGAHRGAGPGDESAGLAASARRGRDGRASRLRPRQNWK